MKRERIERKAIDGERWIWIESSEEGRKRTEEKYEAEEVRWKGDTGEMRKKTEEIKEGKIKEDGWSLSYITEEGENG